MARWASIGSPVTSPIWHRCRAWKSGQPLVDADEAAIHVEHQFFAAPHPSVTGRRPTVTSTFSQASRISSPSAVLDQQHTIARRKPSRPGAKHQLDAQFTKPLFDRAREIAVVAREYLRLRFGRW